MSTRTIARGKTTPASNDGSFKTHGHGVGDVALLDDQPGQADPSTVIGDGREPISIAEVRRTLPVGSRLQVVYLGREQAEPDVRRVTKQTDHEMVCERRDADDEAHGGTVHNDWARKRAERDTNGTIILRDEDGTPYVAYIPMDEDAPYPIEATFPIDPALVSRRREASLSTDPAVLAEIAGSDLAVDRAAVAENAHTPVTVLDALARDESVKVRRKVASNPNTSSLALHYLALDEDHAPGVNETKVRYFVAANPNTSAVALSHLASDPDAAIRSAVARHANTDAATLRAMATPAEGTHLDGDVQHNLAGNPNTPPDVLARWERSTGFVMPQVAKNPSTPVEVLVRMANDTSTGNQVRAMVASNPSTPVGVRGTLIKRGDSWIRRHAAQNPGLTESHAAALALDSDHTVRRALAGNVATPSTVLTRLASDPDSDVRAGVARNPAIAPETMQALLGDPNRNVQTGIARNPVTPAAVLQRMAAGDGTAATWAKQALADRGLA